MQRVRQAGSGPLRSSIIPVGLILLAGFVTVATDRASSVEAQDAAGSDLYAASCAGCHGAGGEGIVGTFPPLAGNPNAADADYVATVITDGRSGTIVVDGVEYNATMPAVSGLSDAELTALTDYVVELADAGGEPVEPEPEPEPIAEPTVGDIDRGHDLFIGSNRFDNGGGACSSCHTAGEGGNLGGQGLGPDLTDVYGTLGGEPGLTAWLANPASETMQPIFADQPLTEAEVADLVAFLGDAPNQDRPNEASDWFLLAGLGGLVILIGGMAIAWRGMRQTYVETLRSRR